VAKTSSGPVTSRDCTSSNKTIRTVRTSPSLPGLAHGSNDENPTNPAIHFLSIPVTIQLSISFGHFASVMSWYVPPKLIDSGFGTSKLIDSLLAFGAVAVRAWAQPGPRMTGRRADREALAADGRADREVLAAGRGAELAVKARRWPRVGRRRPG
jgi:hypothetical protein